MPYIPEEQRTAVEHGDPECLTPGQLNYRLTRVIDDYLGDEPRYSRLAEAVAALECAKLELYRRVGAPMEDDALCRNSDVYRPRSFRRANTDWCASPEASRPSSPETETAPGPPPSAWGRYGTG